MSPWMEGRLLRLALARGLLRWEDLDQTWEGPSAAESDSEPAARWIPRLVASGRLDPADVERLAAEIEEGAGEGTEDWTQNLSGPGTRAESLASDPWPSWRDLRFPAGPAAPPREPAGAASRTSPTLGLSLPLEPDLRFLGGWPRYRIERFLGAGGMGSVYRAFDPSLNRPVALKFLHRNDPGQTERFLREARAQARVDHPGICRVYEAGEVEGRPYIAMQLIEGGNLGAATVGLPLARKVELLRDVARAVHAAHKTGLIHRDLKPGNVLVSPGEAGALLPYVVDFGLARDQEEAENTRSGLVSGTPAYLSPEQAQGLPLDKRSDVYSLGVILYELLAGASPFAGSNPAETLLRVVQEEPPPLRRLAPTVPRDLETIAMKCLEKDPGRRYDSARAVAEDLERFLEGEPILARPAGWGYRLSKRLLKNRALAIVAVAALLLVAAAGAASLRVRWQARERAELAQRFGQRVKDLESRLRLEAFLPRHDTAPFRAAIRRELGEIRGEMVRLGPVAEGPGNAALGRAYLALHQSERAREHLERAWEAGERTPQVAAALGRAVGLSYEKALADAHRFRGAVGGSSREEIETAYRRPALSYLKEGLARGEERRPYLTALIAFYEGRYDEALRDAREAYRREPSFYEAGVLEAEVQAARADDAAEAGRYREAFDLNDRAGAVYAGLLAEVRSDATLYAAECHRRTRRLEIAMAASVPWDEEVPAALHFCDLALAVDHDLGEALGYAARIRWRRGEQRARHGEESRTDLTAAVDLAQRAIQIDPQDALAHRSLAITLRLLAEEALASGQEAGPTLARALAAARRLVAVQPELAASHNALGLTELVIARDQMRRGADPGRAIARASATFQRAVKLNPRYLAGYINMSNAWKVLAEHQSAQGRDPGAAVARAVQALERAIRLNPNYGANFNNLGNAHLTLAEFQLGSGADARPALARAVASYREAFRLRHSYAAFNLAATERFLAEARLARGEDPRSALAAAGRWLDEAGRQNPADADVAIERGRLGEVEARRAARAGEDEGPALAAAAAAFARAESLNPGEPEVFLGQARVERRRAERALAASGRQGSQAVQAVRRGLAQVASALAINPGEARGLMERGALLTLSARLAADAGSREREAAAARRSLAEAVRSNPRLAREAAPLLAELRELAPSRALSAASPN